MKELLLRYARYNVWANAQFADVLLKLTDEQLDMEITSSFPTIRKTVYHMWSAEDIWMQRLYLAEQPVWAEGVFQGSFDDVISNWRTVSADLLAFVEKQFSDDSFAHVMQYYNLKKQSVKVPVHVGLMQVFNHATYHRGQLVTMLRQAGIKKIPSTDYYLFAIKG
ncbi:MAG: DUF664 domain-containing protein [Chitinophagales bacterium]|nr:DUF664 domain-containing protein [Chitinophagales bacterium]